MAEENKDKTKELPAELIIYRLDELKADMNGLRSDIGGVSTEIKTMSKNGCAVGHDNAREIVLLIDDIKVLKARPKEAIIFTSVCLGLILMVAGVFLYLHNTLPVKNAQSFRTPITRMP